MRTKGFSLIELMMVVLIIAILMSIAIPAYWNQAVRAKVAEGLSVAARAKTDVALAYHVIGRLPANRSEAGLPAPESLSGTYVSKVEVTGGVVVITFTKEPELAGKTLELSPLTQAGMIIDWTCRGGTLPTKYLPSACR